MNTQGDDVGMKDFSGFFNCGDYFLHYLSAATQLQVPHMSKRQLLSWRGRGQICERALVLIGLFNIFINL